MNVDRTLSLANFSDNFHEDEKLRSNFVRILMLEPPGLLKTSLGVDSKIPKVLIRFWHDAEIPTDVNDCLQTWQELIEDGFKILTFDDESAAKYIEKAFGTHQIEAFRKCRHPAMRSDYFRLCYIFSSGGFYVDADDVLTERQWSVLYNDDRLKLQPLCYDIPSGSMVPNGELWHSELSTDDRIFYVNNNPLVAPAGHPLLLRALQRATQALLNADYPKDIQSTTGPGNLTAALAAHARELAVVGQPLDFELMRYWDQIAETRWELSYRADARNWRNMDQSQ